VGADPVLGDIHNPQRLNRYAYVLNDPVNYIDPNGMFEIRIRQNPEFPGRFEYEWNVYVAPYLRSAGPSGGGAAREIGRGGGGGQGNTIAPLPVHRLALREAQKYGIADAFSKTLTNAYFKDCWSKLAAIAGVRGFHIEEKIKAAVWLSIPLQGSQDPNALGIYTSAKTLTDYFHSSGREAGGMVVWQPAGGYYTGHIILGETYYAYFEQAERRWKATSDHERSSILVHEFAHWYTEMGDVELASKFGLKFAEVTPASQAIQSFIESGCK
jgi:hypothetical protein